MDYCGETSEHKPCPIIYSYFNAETQRIMYTLERPTHVADEYMCEICLDGKHSDSESENDTLLNYTRILDQIKPKAPDSMVENQPIPEEVEIVYIRKLRDIDIQKLISGYSAI